MEPLRDLVIIGGGAAGLTAAQHAAEDDLAPLVIEEMAAGGQALVIDRLINFPGFPDPVTGVDFSMRLEKQSRAMGVEFLNTSVQSLVKTENFFLIGTPKGEIGARTVILACGAAHRRLEVPGEREFEGRGVSYCGSCDGPFFKNKRIVVVGGGDSACDEALYLSRLSDRVTLLHRGDALSARSRLAAGIIDNPRINLRLKVRVTAIHGQQKVQGVTVADTETGEEERIETDAVFIFVGSAPRTAFLEDVDLDAEGRVVTGPAMETSIPGLFAAGEIRNTPFKQLVVAAGEGAVAARSASRYLASLKDA